LWAPHPAPLTTSPPAATLKGNPTHHENNNMSEQTVSFIKGRHGDIAVHDWGNDKPRYLALLVHGYGEHLGRYQYVARTLQAQGARVFGPDHLGHGLSQGERVLIEDYDAVVDDVQRVVSHFRQQYPTLRHDRHPLRAAPWRGGTRAGAVRPAARRQNGDFRSG
jgi:hypothetical protein